MKRKLLIITTIVFSMTIFAENNDPHLKRLIECINDSNVQCALNEIPRVLNWEYDGGDQNVDNALVVINLASTKYPKLQAVDSLRKYVSYETSVMAVMAKLDMQPKEVIKYAHLTLDLLRNCPPDTSELFTCAALLGNSYEELGSYPLAEKFQTMALELTQDHTTSEYVIQLSNLMRLYGVMGNYTKAQEYATEILHLLSSGSMELDNTTSCLFNVSALYFQMGLFRLSEKYLLQALDNVRAQLGEESITYVNYLTNLAVMYDEMHDYDRAEKCYQHIVDLIIKNKWEEHVHYSVILQNFGAMYTAKGDIIKAEQYLLKALDSSREHYGDNHPEQINILHNLGDLYSVTGRYQLAEQYFLQALELYRHIWGEKQYQSYVSLAFGLGYYYQRRNNAKSEYYFGSCAEIQKKQYLQAVNFMSEQERMNYWNTFLMHTLFDRVLQRFAFIYYNEKASYSASAYDNELFQKGVLLRSSNIIKHSIMNSQDTTLIRQWRELTALQQQIFVLEGKDPTNDYLDKLKNDAEQLEKLVTRSSAAYRENQAMWQITWDSVRNHLSSNQIAIEYMVAPLNDDSTMYCALLLRDTCSYPIMIPLFNEPEVTSLINTTTENQTNFTYSYDGNGEQLSKLVWSKIRPYIKKGETVYFAPSGLLHQLAIESLPYDEDHTMTDMFNLVRLSSTREIVSCKHDTQHTSATLYGGIQYDVASDELLAENEKYSTSDLLASRGIESDTLDRGTIKYLKGTKTEVENINSMLKQNKLQVQLFTSVNANEESFKALSGKHQNILHIATHGFFWTDSTAQKKEYFSQRMVMRLGNDAPAPPTIDPLNRCGLLFAGAQTAWSGHSTELPEGVQDGILTAKEISLLDLRDADLVVLSACETGKGEITGDGVFGLQRAFKQAGAQTIIMSLWPVNDAATQLLMTEFYRNWITNHQSKREAFRDAQNTVRHKYVEPEYWAGFVMLD